MRLPQDRILHIDTEIKDGKVNVVAEWQGELVRCKDCKHWYSDADTGMACEFTNMSQPEDGYCNWGERREL